MPSTAETFANVVVVIELTVLNGPNAPVFVGERLVTALDVDNTQSTSAQCDAIGDIGAAVVRATMRHRVGHPV